MFGLLSFKRSTRMLTLDCAHAQHPLLNPIDI